MMSGLTLGLLSLDELQIKVLQESGKPNEKKYAAKIYPLVKRHHLLLVTLLLTNAAAVESMPIFLDRISSPVIAIIVSVTAVLLFGEVFPQALCSRFGLAIGYYMSPLVYLLMVVLLPISYPLAKLLDCLLGTEHASFFRRAELGVLVDLHGDEHIENEEPLTEDEVLIIQGALQMRDKTVKDSMVPLESVFMILQAGHSRIPLYSGSKEDIVGLILVKRLMLYDAGEARGLAIREVIARDIHRAFRKAPIVRDTTPLYDMLNEFQLGRSHLAIVEAAPSPSDGVTASSKVVGIITLEDVIEELIQEEIIDEDDVYVDVHKRIRVARSFIRQVSTRNLLQLPSRAGVLRVGTAASMITESPHPTTFTISPRTSPLVRSLPSTPPSHADDDVEPLLP
ncbi:PREDICTED: putative DUF21 domain-containing protein At1g03270 isoform X2 [Priapulus caudatus]|uniref:DUF21 domain-containing protein At1g03270 isoform X2 n=1 Tax=Priapulus caudatus TaxID=37621 RepID=A0ABM1DWW9_PRICU|nr:PREDICTED: putative DUF21 domain-containing protein At1g03270 isoform X2 [Priapulus caudatus]